MPDVANTLFMPIFERQKTRLVSSWISTWCDHESLKKWWAVNCHVGTP